MCICTYRCEYVRTHINTHICAHLREHIQTHTYTPTHAHTAFHSLLLRSQTNMDVNYLNCILNRNRLFVTIFHKFQCDKYLHGT